MAKKIESKDLFSPDLFVNEKKNAQELLTVLKSLEQEYKEILQVNTQIAKQSDTKTVEGLRKREQAVKNVTEAEKLLVKIEKETEKVQAKLNMSHNARNENLILERERLKQVTAQQRKAAKETLNQGNAYKVLSARVNTAQAEFKRLSAEFGINSKQAKRAKIELDKVQKELMQIDAAARDGRRNVGNYGTALGGLGKSLKGIGMRFVAITGLIYGLGRAMVSSFKTFKDFQQGNANLAAVLGKSRKEIKSLTEDAKRLGATTAFTASEVTKLQTEFAKFGFKEDEILDATEATLNLAAATGTDLSESAAVAAATLGGFGLEAEETQRVVDVMAASFSQSALDMEKFKESMKLAAPAAKAVGVDVEKTTALLGTLANAGISGSMAGTSLAKSFIQLNKAGLTLEEGLKLVTESENKLGTATDLVGVNAAKSFLILAEGVDTTNDLETALNNAGGAAKEMAEQQLDTLQGSITKMSSAWEGFILSLEDGDGVISQVLKGAIDLTTKLLNNLTALNMSQKQLNDSRKEGNVLLGEEIVVKKQQEIIKFQQMSNAELEKLIKNEGENFGIAQKVLKFRNLGYDALQQQIAANYEFAKSAQQNRKLTDEEVEAQLALFDGIETGLNTKITKELQFQGIQQQGIEQMQTLIKGAERQQLLQFMALSQKEGAGKMEEYLGKLAAAELQRRKDIGEVVSDNTDLIDGQTNSTGKQVDKVNLLADLKKELKDLELERSNYLIQNQGVEDETYFTMTQQVKQKQELIKLYEMQLGYTDQIFEAEKRGVDLQDQQTENKLDEIDTTVNAIPEEYMKTQKDLIEFDRDAWAERLDAASQFYTALAELSNERIEKEIENIDKEIDASLRRQEQLESIANQDQLTSEQSIAAEIRRRAELERQKEQLEKRKLRRETISKGLELLSANLNAGQDGGDAVASSIRQLTSFIALLSNLPGFYTGTDNAPEGLAWTDEKGAEIHLDKNGVIKDWGSDKGARLKHLSKGDRILTAQESKIVKSQMGVQPHIEAREIRIQQRALSGQKYIVDGLRNVVRAVDEKPVQSFEYDEIKKAVIDQMASRSSVERKHQSNKPKFM